MSLIKRKSIQRIIFTVTNDLTTDQRMIKICNSLANNGYLVTLIGRKLSNSVPLSIKSFRQVRLFCFFTKGFLFYFEYNIRLFLYLIWIKPYCFSAVDLDTILPCLFAAKIRGCKLGYDAHEYFTEVPELVNRPFIKSIWKKIERFSIPKTDFRYTVSASIAELLGKEYDLKFELILNTPVKDEENNQIFFPEIQDFEKLIVLYQGALNLGRGLEELIKSIDLINDDRVQIWIVGNGYLMESLKKEALKIKKTSHILFKGQVNPVQLKNITQVAFLGYNLLENKGLSYYYSLSNKFFDYIHAGVPSLNPPFPEYENILTQYQVGVTINLDSQVIAEIINSIILDNTRYLQFKHNCILASDVYQWATQEQMLLKIYNN